MRIKLIELCEARGLTQAKIAEALGMSRNGYSHIEYGERKIDIVRAKQIKDLLGYYDDDLFDNTPPGPELDRWMKRRAMNSMAKRGLDRKSISQRRPMLNGKTSNKSRRKYVL